MSTASKEILTKFVEGMKTYCAAKGYGFEKSPLGPQNLHLYILGTKDKVYWCFIHVSTSVGLWGVSADWQDRINKVTGMTGNIKSDWFVALLDGGPETGYRIPSDEFRNLMNDLSVGGTGKGQIKIERKHLRPTWRFHNFNGLAP